MTPKLFAETAVMPALRILSGFMPPSVNTPVAARFITAIAIQESRLKARRQMADGPARSFLQFESVGVDDALSHPRSRREASKLCEILCYRLTADEPKNIALIMAAIEHNDVLAAGFARLNLWNSNHVMPATEDDGWRIYLDQWRPGKPDRQRWVTSWADGQSVV